MPGTRYRLSERIGAGGMAEVFRARMRATQGFERAVAIKRVRPDKAAHPRCAERFVHEACLLAALRHPNVVGANDLARDDEVIISKPSRGGRGQGGERRNTLGISSIPDAGIGTRSRF